MSKTSRVAKRIYSIIVRFNSKLSDNMALSGRVLAASDHLMNYTNTNQLIILFTSLNFLSVFVFNIIDMLSRWNNQSVKPDQLHMHLLENQTTRSPPIKLTFYVNIDTKNHSNITRHMLIYYCELSELIFISSTYHLSKTYR